MAKMRLRPSLSKRPLTSPPPPKHYTTTLGSYEVHKKSLPHPQPLFDREARGVTGGDGGKEGRKRKHREVQEAQNGEGQMQRHERVNASRIGRRVAGHWGIGRVCGSDEKRGEGEAAVAFRWWGRGGWSER